MLALAVDVHTDGLAVTAGAAAALDPEAAALKALVESAQGRLWLKFLGPQPERKYEPPEFANVNDFDDHVLLYARLSSIPYLDFLLAQSPARSFKEVIRIDIPFGDDLAHCVTELAARGFDVIVVDITRPDVAELGFVVVKVLVPGLVDINADHRFPPLGADRLFSVPERIGLRQRRTTEIDMNPIPHPFP